MSRDCRECGNCGNCGGCNGHNHDDRCEFIACERQLRAAKETIKEAEEILEGKRCGHEHDGHDCGCGHGDLRECEFKLRIANKRIVKSADVLNDYIDEYINNDCECCCCSCCCCEFDNGCQCNNGCSNYYDNPNKYDRETCGRNRNNCGCGCGCGCWGR